jgi:redox-sensitive bicupin YhaK (pirin superfamily)
MCDPWYRDIPGDTLPGFAIAEGASVRVIAGETHGVRGAVQRDVTQPLYLDVHLEPGAAFDQPLPAAHNAFVYVHRGAVESGETRVPAGRMAIFENAAGSDGVSLRSTKGAQVLLIAGAPLNEPIAQYGPFVMNSRDEIEQALDDFRSGRFAAQSA